VSYSYHPLRMTVPAAAETWSSSKGACNEHPWRAWMFINSGMVKPVCRR